MKRKKFVKMLLSRRVPRNLATLLADYAAQLRVPYDTALGDWLLRMDLGTARKNGHDVRPPASCKNWLNFIDEAVTV